MNVPKIANTSALFPIFLCRIPLAVRIQDETTKRQGLSNLLFTLMWISVSWSSTYIRWDNRLYLQLHLPSCLRELSTGRQYTVSKSGACSFFQLETQCKRAQCGCISCVNWTLSETIYSYLAELLHPWNSNHLTNGMFLFGSDIAAAEISTER